jgi:malic enzyme
MRATAINEEMKVAAAMIAELARERKSRKKWLWLTVNHNLREYIISHPSDPRLMERVSRRRQGNGFRCRTGPD